MRNCSVRIPGQALRSAGSIGYVLVKNLPDIVRVHKASAACNSSHAGAARNLSRMRDTRHVAGFTSRFRFAVERANF